MPPLYPASASPLHLSFDRSQRECDSAPEAAPGAPSRAPPARSEDLMQTPPRRGKVPLSGVLISLVGWLHLRCTSCLDSTMESVGISCVRTSSTAFVLGPLPLSVQGAGTNAISQSTRHSAVPAAASAGYILPAGKLKPELVQG